MDRKKQVEICKQCLHHKFDSKIGIKCGLTNSIQAFENDCDNFVLHDKKELNVVEKFEKRFLERGGSKLELYEFEAESDDVDVKEEINENEAQIIYVKPRSKFVRKYRRILKVISISILAIAFIMLAPFFAISSPELKAIWLLEFQPIITYKILFTGAALSTITLIINALNSKRTEGILKLEKEGVIIETETQFIPIKFNEISLINMSLVFSGTDDYFIYRIEFKCSTPQNEEYRIHLKDNTEHGKEVIEFLLSNESLNIKQK